MLGGRCDRFGRAVHGWDQIVMVAMATATVHVTEAERMTTSTWEGKCVPSSAFAVPILKRFAVGVRCCFDILLLRSNYMDDMNFNLNYDRPFPFLQLLSRVILFIGRSGEEILISDLC